MAYQKQHEAEAGGGYSATPGYEYPLLGHGSPATPSAPPLQQPLHPQDVLPSYEAAVSRPTNLEFVDFLPERKNEPPLQKPRYEPFSVLVKRANEWLASNTDKRVLTCESVAIACDTDDKIKKMYEDSDALEVNPQTFFRLLRLWVVDRHPEDTPEAQQIGYINVVPTRTCTEEELSYRPSYEPYTETLTRFNQELRTRPIPGRVLNMETRAVKSPKDVRDIDPDESSWKEPGYGTGCVFIYVTRVFFELGQPAYEQLGSVDFTPLDDCSNLSKLLARTQDWLLHQSGFRITNIQSINYSFENALSELDTAASFYKFGETKPTQFARIIRVFYTILQNPVSDVPKGLTLRNFIPATTQGRGGFCEMYEYENTTQTKERLAAWFRVSGAKLLSAETVQVLTDSDSDAVSPEQCNKTIYVHKAQSIRQYMKVYRVYFRESYSEVPPHLLPPPPRRKGGENCCCYILCCCCIGCRNLIQDRDGEESSSPNHSL